MFRLADFSLLVPFLKRERASYGLGVLLVAATSVCVVAVPRVLGFAVESLTTGIRTDRLPLLCFLLIGVVLLRGVTSFWMRRVLIGASRRVEFALRNRLFRHMESLDADYFARFHTGDLMSRFTSDVDAVRMSIGPGVMYLANTVFTSGLALTVMFGVSPRLTLVSLVPLVLLTVVIRMLGPAVHRESLRAQTRLADISVHAQENFSNTRVVKAFVREHVEIGRMASLSDAYFDQNMRLARIRSLTHALLWLFGDLLVLVLLAVGGLEIIRGALALDEFVVFKGCQLLLIWPMIALGWVVTIFQRGAASAHRLREILGAQPDIDDRNASPESAPRDNGIRFESVEFEHEPGRPVLSGIDFELRPGRTLGIVGPTGSGKTTLLDLVARVHDPTRGSIEIGGRGLPEIPLAKLRSVVSVVPQEAFLFSTTIERNIAFGVDGAPAEEIRHVAALVKIDEEIESFPRGYEQRVGERGITLSGGQKQRIALARALIEHAPILVLDDVLSAVDAETEAHILRSLRAETDGLTVLVASHRLSSVQHADLILVLDRGRVVQRGIHSELVQLPGFYRDQYLRQSLEDELESL
ncbi:MAG: ABC transporter ATP-binding protein [Planctomycetes bacterium]|nr:ABC transporter ATP-binding protein [Planctomycetota bacterium]